MATAKPKTKRMMSGGVAAPAGASKPPLKFMSNLPQGKLNRQMQAAKPGMGPKPGMEPTFKAPSLNSVKRDIKTHFATHNPSERPRGPQLQSFAKDITSALKAQGLQKLSPSMLGSQRALPANQMPSQLSKVATAYSAQKPAMKKGGAVKKRAFKK